MAMDLQWLYILLGTSLLAGFLPRSFFDAIQLSQTTSLYKKIGIRMVKKFTQDGDFINRLIRRKFPQYRIFDPNVSIQKHLNKAYSIEKIHFIMFLFFLLTSIYALTQGYARWAAIITINNLVFNLYPNFLQQYNRLRLRNLMRKPTLNYRSKVWADSSSSLTNPKLIRSSSCWTPYLNIWKSYEASSLLQIASRA
jgi:hypothetical protein